MSGVHEGVVARREQVVLCKGLATGTITQGSAMPPLSWQDEEELARWNSA
jgi:hypothetical protein